MLGEILAFATALLWAASMILTAKTLKSIGPLYANALKTLFGCISMIPIAFVMGEIQNIPTLDLSGFAIVTLAAIIGFGVGDACVFRSMQLTGVSRAYIVANSFPLITMFLATLFLGEPFLLKYLIGAFIVFFAIVAISTGKNDEGTQKSSKGLLYAIAAAFSWAIGTTLVAQGLTRISIILANTLRFPFVFIFLLLLVRPWKRKLKLSRKNLTFLAAAGSLGMALGGITFLFGMKLIGVSRTAPLVSSSSVWAVLMSNFLLKEKITWRVIVSSLMVVVAIYFLT